MKRKFLSTILICAVTLAVCTPVFFFFKIELDGRLIQTDTPPTISQGRTFVPMRSIFEALGANIIWTDASKSVLATLGEKTVFITVGDSLAFVDNSPVTLDTPAKIVNNRVLVPVRFVSEALGYTVDWDSSTQTINIISDSSNLKSSDTTANMDPIDDILPVSGKRPEVDTTPDGNNTKITGDFTTKGKLVGNKFVGKVFAYYTSTKEPVFYGEISTNLKYNGEWYIFENEFYLKGTFDEGVLNGKATFFYNDGYFTVDVDNDIIKDGEYNAYDYDNNYIGGIKYNNGVISNYSLTKRLFY